MRFHSLLLSALLCLICFAQAQGQQRVLTLQESISLAQTSGPSADIARLQYSQSSWNFRSFRGTYLPSMTFSGNVPNLQRSIQPVTQNDGSVIYRPQNTTLGSATVSINQPIPKTGGQFFVSSGVSRLTNTFEEIDVTQWNTTPLLLGISQPIFQFNNLKWNRRIEPMRFQLAQRTFIEDLEGVAVDITGRFFDVYLAQMNLEMATANVAVNDTIFQLAQGRYEIGTIAENELLETELALLNAQSDQANTQIEFQEVLQDLIIALGLPYDTELVIVPPSSLPAMQIDPHEAVSQAQQNRPVFLNLEIQSVEAERDLVQAKRASNFSANVTASFGLNQSALNISDAYSNPLNQQQFNVNFQVPLYHGGRGKADIESALAAQQRAQQDAELQRKELEQDVYFEVLQLLQLQQQVAIAAKADTVASRRFEVAKNRYLIGRISITDLFNAQREKDQSRRSYIQTMRQFWNSYYNVRRLTLYDFGEGHPLHLP